MWLTTHAIYVTEVTHNLRDSRPTGLTWPIWPIWPIWPTWPITHVTERFLHWFLLQIFDPIEFVTKNNHTSITTTHIGQSVTSVTCVTHPSSITQLTIDSLIQLTTDSLIECHPCSVVCYQGIMKHTTVACGAVTCPFSVSRQSVPQFCAEQCPPDCQRISPVSAACYPLCRTACDRQTPRH